MKYKITIGQTTVVMSPSLRRVWVEIPVQVKAVKAAEVTLLAEGVG